MHLFRLIFSSLLLTVTCFARETFVQQSALSDLELIRNSFAVHYAPRMWKNVYAGWDLDTEIQYAKNRIINLSNPSLKECQLIIRDFFNRTRDYHVGVKFCSTEFASLPFLVKRAEDRYFVCDRSSSSPFRIGDEILTFGGRPIQQVIDEIVVSEGGINTCATDISSAELSLTIRSGFFGDPIPSGPIEITGRKKGSSQEIKTTLEWDYDPEEVEDLSHIRSSDLFAKTFNQEDLEVPNNAFFMKSMTCHRWKKHPMPDWMAKSSHGLGSYKSFLPSLGKKTWTSSSSYFDAYIFKTPSGKRLGYIRIPHFGGWSIAASHFGAIMDRFQRETDALIIDQLNNPGGYVIHLYALTSMLTNKPLSVPKHHLTLTQEEVFDAIDELDGLEGIYSDSSARNRLGDTIAGYPIDYEYAMKLKEHCNFIISEWNSGNFYTDEIHLYGVDTIKPNPKHRYTKPILCLINEQDFSCADFFAAILQDNKRATLMGTRTAGAGGIVSLRDFSNYSGIYFFTLTTSLGIRADESPIENNGVLPDISYQLTVEDLQNNYRSFSKAILEQAEALLQ